MFVERVVTSVIKRAFESANQVTKLLPNTRRINVIRRG